MVWVEQTMTCKSDKGFTLLELIVVITVLGILVGTAIPLAGAAAHADGRTEVVDELEEISEALDAYWFDNISFPSSLDATDFLGVYLQAGPQNTAIYDPFGKQLYRYSVDTGTNIATVYSVGEDRVDGGSGSEEFVVEVYASVPGLKRTWQRLRIIVEVLAEHIESGGSVSGSWTSLRTLMGLGATFEADGFGTTLQWASATHTLTSAGPDRVFGTADDVTL